MKDGLVYFEPSQVKVCCQRWRRKENQEKRDCAMRKLLTMLMMGAAVFAFTGCGDQSTEEEATDAFEEMREDAEKTAEEMEKEAEKAAEEAESTYDSFGD